MIINAELEMVKTESNRVLMELESTMERIQYLERKLAVEEEAMGGYKLKFVSRSGDIGILRGVDDLALYDDFSHADVASVFGAASEIEQRT